MTKAKSPTLADILRQLADTVERESVAITNWRCTHRPGIAAYSTDGHSIRSVGNGVHTVDLTVEWEDREQAVRMHKTLSKAPWQ